MQNPRHRQQQFETFNESHLREARKFGIAVIRPAEVLRGMKK
jgi:hypothetical protein